MRTVIARIFDYSLDGIVAAEGTSSAQYFPGAWDSRPGSELVSATAFGNGTTELAFRRIEP